MRYILDTNILVNRIRKSSFFYQLSDFYKFKSTDNQVFASIVSMGEILSLSIQLGWGKKRVGELEELFKEINFISIHQREIIDTYAEIDAYSQGKHPTLKLPTTARNMGKNDLWIAATAHVLQANLVTTDKDFDHLHQVFFDVIHD